MKKSILIALSSVCLSFPVNASDNLSRLSQRYGECNPLLAAKQSDLFLSCLLRPLHSDAKEKCQSGGKCEKVGLFRAISIVNEMVENKFSLQTPIKIALGPCDQETTGVRIEEKILRILKEADYRVRGDVFPWFTLCDQDRPLYTLVDEVAEAHLNRK